MQNHLLFLYTETALHAGIGSSVSVVDLPIQRERTTQYPIVQGSGVKGALRSHFVAASADAAGVSTVFGDDNPKGSTFAGAMAVGEARIVLFPVRALKGVFAYVTSAHALARLKRELGDKAPADLPAEPGTGTALVSSGTSLAAGNTLVLEEFSFKAAVDNSVKAWANWLADQALPTSGEYSYWRTHINNMLIVLPEDDFRDFVVNSTQVDTHVRLNPATKTVATGALWTTESLPSDTLLVSTVTVRDARSGTNTPAAEIFKWVHEQVGARIQLGGDETTGQGVVALRWL